MADGEKRCDPEDLLCQMQVLSHLRGLKGVLGDEKFKSDFPELQSLDERIKEREISIKEAFERCGMAPIEPAESKEEEL